jgi:glycosyltransferase involved in cell wall biosynthesis
MSKKPTLDIILPMYHPPAGWEKVVYTQFKALEHNLLKHFDALHLILVNDGTPQTTPLLTAIDYVICSVPASRVIHKMSNHGKGHTLRVGVADSSADFIMVTDIDFPFEQESMIAMAHQLLNNQADIVAGQRDDTYFGSIPKFRKRLSKVFAWINAHLFKLPVHQTQCGLKGFNQRGKEIFLMTTIDRYLYDLEFLLLAVRQKNIIIAGSEVRLRPGIKLSNISLKTLLQEAVNLVKIFFRAKVQK